MSEHRDELVPSGSDQDRSDSADPFAELAGLWSRVDPEKPQQSFRLLVCVICGSASGWADVWTPGSKGLRALSDFKTAQRRATQGSGPFGSVGHDKWHAFDINRYQEH